MTEEFKKARQLLCDQLALDAKKLSEMDTDDIGKCYDLSCHVKTLAVTILSLVSSLPWSQESETHTGL